MSANHCTTCKQIKFMKENCCHLKGKRKERGEEAGNRAIMQVISISKYSLCFLSQNSVTYSEGTYACIGQQVILITIKENYFTMIIRYRRKTFKVPSLVK